MKFCVYVNHIFFLVTGSKPITVLFVLFYCWFKTIAWPAAIACHRRPLFVAGTILILH